MEITIHLYYTGQNGSAQKFVNEMITSGTVDQIKAELGNLQYDYFVSYNDPETILLIDKWTSQEALNYHHASPMMAKISELREKYDLHMHIERLFPATDEIPEQDAQYIRT